MNAQSRIGIGGSLLPKVLRHRLPGGALQLTLGIAVIIATLCSAMILLGYYARVSFLQSVFAGKLLDNAASGIQYLMANRNNVPFNTSQAVDLFDEGIDSVAMLRKPWGTYEIITVRAQRGNKSFEKSAMITALAAGVGESVLYIPENNSPIYVAGHAKIEGTAYLPERGLSTSFVDGKSFTEKKMLYGEKHKSDRQMPPLDTALLANIKAFFGGIFSGYELRTVEDLPNGINRPFFSTKTDYFYSRERIEITDTLVGNLIVHSAQSVTVGSRAYLSGILVIAPEIEIENDFYGDAQFFATKLITVGTDAHLSYPTTLALVGQLEDSLIVIGAGSKVEGQVIIQGMDYLKESAGVFKVEKTAIFHGCAYINATADIQGSLWGHLATKRIQTSVLSTVYANHVLDATLSHWQKSLHMPGSLLWGNKEEFVVAKWLE